MAGHIETLDGLLAGLWERGGTDLIFSAGLPPMLRTSSELHAAEGHPALSGDDIAGLVDALLSDLGRSSLGDTRELDFAFTWRNLARIRANAYFQRCAVSLALRMIPHEIPSADVLGVPAAVAGWAKLHRGLVLVTGPTGGGKSTTLAALIDGINASRRCHVITIEDPIEYVFDHKLSVVDQREIGQDTGSFPDALRAALREDPDVVLVGEMRDLESIRFALTIAETGHLVFATLHTNDTAQALDRIVDVFPSDQQPQIRVQLAATLTGICYQRLIPRIGGGLVAAYEVLVATSAVRNLVREGKSNQLRNQLVTGASAGMQTLEVSLSDLVARGLIDYDEALRVSLYPKEVARPLPPIDPATGLPMAVNPETGLPMVPEAFSIQDVGSAVPSGFVGAGAPSGALTSETGK
jgi:twitching motility protein PilT